MTMTSETSTSLSPARGETSTRSLHQCVGVARRDCASGRDVGNMSGNKELSRRQADDD